MRLDIQRIKASAVRVGDVLCFFSPDRSQDSEVWSIYFDGKKLHFNEDKQGSAVAPSDFVFISFQKEQ
jgi:hypothetical protein